MKKVLSILLLGFLLSQCSAPRGAIEIREKVWTLLGIRAQESWAIDNSVEIDIQPEEITEPVVEENPEEEEAWRILDEAIEKNDINLCDTISGTLKLTDKDFMIRGSDVWRNFCQYSLIQHVAEYKICDKFSTQKVSKIISRDDCLNEVARTRWECEKTKSEIESDYCYATWVDNIALNTYSGCANIKNLKNNALIYAKICEDIYYERITQESLCVKIKNPSLFNQCMTIQMNHYKIPELVSGSLN